MTFFKFVFGVGLIIALFLIYGIIKDIDTLFASAGVRTKADLIAECPVLGPERVAEEHFISCYGFLERETVQVMHVCEDGFRAIIKPAQNICKYREEPIIQ